MKLLTILLAALLVIGFSCNVSAISCPVIKPGVFGICIQECFRDIDCGYGGKCCFNGCGRVCNYEALCQVCKNIHKYIPQTIKFRIVRNLKKK